MAEVEAEAAPDQVKKEEVPAAEPDVDVKPEEAVDAPKAEEAPVDVQPEEAPVDAPKAEEPVDAPSEPAQPEQPEEAPVQNDADAEADAPVGAEPAAADDEKKKADEEEEESNPGCDFTGTWVLKSSSKSIEEYYKTEGWGYMMRKMAQFVAIKQIIKQKGDTMTLRMIVGPGGKFADETSTAVIGSGKESQYKDKDGLCNSVSKWNEDKTQIISDSYRVDNPKHTYTMVRAFSMLSDNKMICTTKNSFGKELVQNFERVPDGK